MFSYTVYSKVGALMLAGFALAAWALTKKDPPVPVDSRLIEGALAASGALYAGSLIADFVVKRTHSHH